MPEMTLLIKSSVYIEGTEKIERACRVRDRLFLIPHKKEPTAQDSWPKSNSPSYLFRPLYFINNKQRCKL